MRRQEEGFTLIELVIVLVILGILAAVAVPQFYNATADAQEAAKSTGKAATATALAVATARAKAAPNGSLVAAEMTGTKCSAGSIEIGTGTGVKVALAPTVTGCDSVVTGVGAATYGSL